MNNLIGVSGKIKSGKDLVGKAIQYYTTQELQDRCTVEEYVTTDIPLLNEPTYEIKKYADKLKDIVCLLTNLPREDIEKQDIKDMTIGEYTGDPWIRHMVKVELMHEDSVVTNTITLPTIYTDFEKAKKDGEEYSKRHYDKIRYDVVTEDLTFRLLMQYIGTEAFRRTIHPDTWVKGLFSEYDEILSHWIITDTRFPNEGNRIIDEGGIVIRVERPLNLRFPDLYSEYGKSNFKSPFQEYIFAHHNDLYNVIMHESETSLDYYGKFKYTIDNNSNNLKDFLNKIKTIVT